MVKVKELMTTDVVTARPDDSISEALEKMRTGRFRRIPVVDRGRLTGVITDRDIRQALNSPMLFRDRSYDDYVLRELKVGGSMTSGPLTIHPDAGIVEAAEMMEKNRIGGLPVVDNDSLVGIITISDLMNYLIRLLREERL
ncbi:MAG: CBS domain-containing protein [Desulfomonilia bacterium]|jgi:acetoin utilization protein AcuB|uniref:Inosine-5'-monophosphate dehydrogenase n=1 Tax=anaerobic digester metagenome TaxID=1263854 RepID=A0A485M859_9ZZZZ|nr:CBS domain-containing protein [Pseudomonadota bacterium]HON38665.1 CBS domain-containing protein [Deltaproteobacteria bacterium]HRS56179.1 CBS domain-containing protein [Desulfomonilia bacterium]HPD21144.1 CBS domain-containing protein [Deltaproteobacteria bacterium]HPX18111.1 CBS domain-containing protein [Deltaproteobacteria bacterium]